MENKEGVLVGIRTTTLKEIEDKDYSQKRYHDAVLFGINDPLEDRSQESRYEDIPDGVPFMFGVGGGLHVLSDMKDSQPVWRTIKWEGDPPWNREIGRTYFTERGYVSYAEIGKNDRGGWVWQKMEDPPEKPSFKTGKKDWNYKIYFGSEYSNSASLNNQLNEKGWGVTGVAEDESYVIPDELESQGLEPDFIDGMRFLNYLVVDPDRAEIRKVKWNEMDKVDEESLEKDGWEFVDSNIARSIYVRTKS